MKYIRYEIAYLEEVIQETKEDKLTIRTPVTRKNKFEQFSFFFGDKVDEIMTALCKYLMESYEEGNADFISVSPIEVIDLTEELNYRSPLEVDKARVQYKKELLAQMADSRVFSVEDGKLKLIK